MCDFRHMPLKPFQPPSWDAARGPWVRHFRDRHNAALISRKRSIVSSLAEFGRPPDHPPLIRGGLDFVGRFQIEGRPQFVPGKERIGVSPMIHFNVESIT